MLSPSTSAHGSPSRELLADGEGLRQAVGARLLGVGEVHAVARAVPEQALEVGQVGRGGDDQDVPDTRQHEGGQRIVDHGLVVDRQQLLAGDERERVQTRARATREDDAFHVKLLDTHFWLQEPGSYSLCSRFTPIHEAGTPPIFLLKVYP